ncbi:hypothetical protein Anapl_16403 [Anas platyrhynchos]|uniref:Uncharacterized protein n=1 Tax=Anas platyrhynchos TaxID=8839 RepID=R0JAE1_ANAPL|nr:hypothetical protein Anapl_16403 [Anas platyrhynchos]
MINKFSWPEDRRGAKECLSEARFIPGDGMMASLLPVCAMLHRWAVKSSKAYDPSLVIFIQMALSSPPRNASLQTKHTTVVFIFETVRYQDEELLTVQGMRIQIGLSSLESLETLTLAPMICAFPTLVSPVVTIHLNLRAQGSVNNGAACLEDQQTRQEIQNHARYTSHGAEVTSVSADATGQGCCGNWAAAGECFVVCGNWAAAGFFVVMQPSKSIGISKPFRLRWYCDAHRGEKSGAVLPTASSGQKGQDCGSPVQRHPVPEMDITSAAVSQGKIRAGRRCEMEQCGEASQDRATLACDLRCAANRRYQHSAFEIQAVAACSKLARIDPEIKRTALPLQKAVEIRIRAPKVLEQPRGAMVRGALSSLGLPHPRTPRSPRRVKKAIKANTGQECAPCGNAQGASEMELRAAPPPHHSNFCRRAVLQKTTAEVQKSSRSRMAPPSYLGTCCTVSCDSPACSRCAWQTGKAERTSESKLDGCEEKYILLWLHRYENSLTCLWDCPCRRFGRVFSKATAIIGPINDCSGTSSCP